MAKKSIQVKKSKWFWTHFIWGGLFILLSIILAPIWNQAGSWCFFKDWGKSIIDLILAAMLLVYLFGYLIKRVLKAKRGTIRVLTIVEFILLFLIAIGCVLSQFQVIPLKEPCQIFGFALWCRGVVELFRAYYFHHSSGDNDRYPIWWLVIAIVMVSFGIWCIANPFIQKITLLWVFVSIVLLLGIFGIALGILSKPSKK